MSGRQGTSPAFDLVNVFSDSVLAGRYPFLVSAESVFPGKSQGRVFTMPCAKGNVPGLRDRRVTT
jgi:hypothetical protein